jgi:lipid-A-disaccharide synthase-like uncharacterized protein
MDLVATAAAKFVAWWVSTPGLEKAWLAIGLMAQLLFSMRFIVQWVASERARRSIVPETFWYFSCTGGLLLLAYALYRADPVFVLGQGTGLLIYARNIHFIWQGRRGFGLASDKLPAVSAVEPRRRHITGERRLPTESAAGPGRTC